MSPDAAFHIRTGNELRREGEPWLPRWRVLGISASPRGQKGVTHRVYQALARGMERAGAKVETVVLAGLDIKPCRGCFRCWTRPGPGTGCVLEDGLAPLLEAVPAAGLMVWAMPVYVEGMPGIMKNCLDRMMVLNHPAVVMDGGRPIHPSRHPEMPWLAALLTCGLPGVENTATLAGHLKAVARQQHTPLISILRRPGTLGLMHPKAGKVMDKVLEALETAGEDLVLRGGVAPETARAVARPLLGRKEFFQLAGHWWEGNRG